MQLIVLAGYLHDVYIAGASLFYILIVAQSFFGSAGGRFDQACRA